MGVFCCTGPVHNDERGITMPHFIMGTAGHIDHGKSTLIKCLTGIDTDRLPEEKARGMSIDLGFAHIALPGGNVLGIVDVPGHERFLRNMIAGVNGMDLAVLVVSALEGIKPQTVEHTDILNLLSLQGGVVALTKADSADDELIQARSSEIRNFLAGTFLAHAPVIPVSSTTGRGRPELLASLDEITEKMIPRDLEREYRVTIDRVFTKQGFGTIVTGTLLSGTLARGEKVMVMPAGMESKIRSLQVYNLDVEKAHAGERVAINLSGMEKFQVKRGFEISPAGFFTPTTVIDVRLRALSRSPQPFRNNAPVRVYMGTGEYKGRVKILEGQEIPPGEEAYTQLILDEPAVCLRGDRFIVRNASALFTMGGGLIVDPYPQRHKRGRGEVLEVLMKKDSADSSDVVAGQFMQEKERVFTLEELSKRLQIPETSLKESLASLEKNGIVKILAVKNGYMAKAAYGGIVASIFAVLQGLEDKSPSVAGWRKEEIAKGALPYRKEAVEAILEELLAEKRLRSKAGLFSRPGHIPRLDGPLEALHQKLQRELRDMGYSPDFRPDLIKKVKADEKSFRAVEEFMLDKGELIKLTPEFYLLSETLDSAKEAIAGFIRAHGLMSPAQARDLLKTSRKYIIPLLEFLDRARFTKRAGEGRLLA